MRTGTVILRAEALRPRTDFLDSPSRACLGMNTDLFYDPGTINEAKKVCATCTLRMECLDYAMANDELGVWGGTTQRERNRLRQRWAA